MSQRRDPDAVRFLQSFLWLGLADSYVPPGVSQSLGIWLIDGAVLQPVFSFRLRGARVCRPREGAVGRCFATGDTALCGDVENYPRDDDVSALCSANGFRCFILLPIGIGRIRIGVLGVFGKDADAGTADRARSLEPRTEQLALHLVLSEATLSRLGRPTVEGDGAPGYPERARIAPKGIQASTLSRVYRYMLSLSEPVDAETAARDLGISGVTVRKYLEHLTHNRLLEATMTYGKPGRPLKRYAVRRFPGEGQE